MKLPLMVGEPLAVATARQTPLFLTGRQASDARVFDHAGPFGRSLRGSRGYLRPVRRRPGPHREGEEP